MNLRADHVAGATFVVFGAAVIALSGDLPVGQLSMPGSGFLPMIVAILTIVFGAALVLRANESGPFADLDWEDGKHAAMVAAITAVGIALYTYLGFTITMILMMVSLLIVIERRNPLSAGIYSIAVVVATFAAFEWMLKTPLPASFFSY